MDIPAPTEYEEHTPANPMYPEIVVHLSHQDGNVFVLAGLVRGALREAKAARDDVEFFTTQLFESPSYEAALELMQSMVTVR